MLNRLFQASVLAVALIFGGTTAIKHYITHKIHASTHFIAFKDYSRCTAVAIGPHAVMTAHHCGSFVPVTVDGKPAKMQEVFNDEHDHVIMYLSGITFRDYVPVQLHVAQLDDPVFMFGNPIANDLMDQLRHGYVSGVQTAHSLQLQVFVMPVIPGDSGSFIFDPYGRLVGELTYVNGPFALSYRISFTPAQFKAARNYDGSVQAVRQMCDTKSCAAIPDNI